MVSNKVTRALALAVLIAFAALGCKGRSKAALDAAPAKEAPAKPDVAPNVKAVDVLLHVIGDRYSHRDHLGLDWDGKVAAERAALEGAKSPAEFAGILVRLFAEAKDPHLSVGVDGVKKIQPTFAPPLVFNIDIEYIGKRVKGIRDVSPCLSVGTLDKKTGYLLLRSFSRNTCTRFLSSLSVAWKEIGALPRLVIDLRGNTGGDENLGRTVAARFVKSDVDYALTELGPPRNKSTRFPRRLMGAIEAQQFKGDTRVLIGGANMSSAEAFVLMMKKAERTKLVGAKTYGSSGNPKGATLGNGVTVYLPSWRAFTPEGVALEGTGIAPDIAVDWPEKKAPGSGDPVLDAALKSF